MTTKYSIVQFLPDPSNDERINIGVVGFDDEGRTEHAFLKNWGRVKSFGNLKHLGRLESSVDDLVTHLDREWIEWAVNGMSHSIQLSHLRVSTRPLSEVVANAAEELLIDPPERHFPKRTRDTLRRKANIAVESSLSKYYDSNNLIVGSLEFSGTVANHRFDVAAQNGSPLLAAPVISLIQSNRDLLRKQIGSAAWALQDIEASHVVKKRAIFIISDEGINTDALEEVRKVFPQYGAEVVEYEAVDVWADNFAEALA